MTPLEYAQEIAARWGDRRPGGLPPAAPLEYLAEQSFVHASTIWAFKGDKAAWVALVVAQAGADYVPAPPSPPPPPRVVVIETPTPPPAMPAPEPSLVVEDYVNSAVTPPAPPSPPPPAEEDDLDAWLKG